MNHISTYFQDITTKKVILIFFAIGIIIYANSLFNKFLGDDTVQIKNNPSVHSITKIPSLFFQGTFPKELYGDQVNNYYRPLMSSSFAIIYLFSRDNPFGFHLIQIILHITNSILIYLIFKHFFVKYISLTLSLIFLVHPFNTEAIIYAANLQEPLFMVFGLTALFLTLRETKKSILITSLLLASLLSKEIGIVFLFLIPAFNFLYKKGGIFWGLLQSFFALLTYIFLRFVIANVYFPQNVTSPIMTLSFWERVGHIPKIISFYLKTFFYPKDLLAFQSWILKSFEVSNFYLPLIIVILFLLIITICAFIFYGNGANLFKTYILFILWFFVGIGIHLQIVPLDQTVADRWFYFPMVGLLGIIGTLIKHINAKKHFKFNIVVLPVLLIIMLFGLRVIIRNMNWKDGRTLYEHDIQYNQDSYQLETAMGNISISKGNIDEAEAHYVRATELFPELDTFSYLGKFYLSQKKYLEAIKAFATAINYNPNISSAWAYLAVSKYKNNDKDDALADAKKAYSLFQSKTNLSILKTIELGKEINLK